MRESDIMHERGSFWVGRERRNGGVQYTVYKTGFTHSVSDSAYLDLSIAIARCDYLAKRLDNPA